MTDTLYEGLIVRSIGGWYTVACGEELVECRARGSSGWTTSNPWLATGCVSCARRPGTRLSEEVCARVNSLIRPAVANIGTLVVIASEAPPVTQPFLIDRVERDCGA